MPVSAAPATASGTWDDLRGPGRAAPAPVRGARDRVRPCLHGTGGTHGAYRLVS
ncbi:hypothetical protein [Streptomyces minutiscleroticus]|uniref:Uncharacterized protein n=1 Tax=Streptomyces minutiscleroticus TaxID=68238 RepID=A0A918KCR6_9ACTN|nr:hypothetical protein [Streptomyces minutiscleroticus]GGX59110.1 hypothetical protein GCM10010358_11720 [Streptomyces minutiscleroticus]